MKKMFAVLLSVMLLLGMLSMTAFADELGRPESVGLGG